MTKSKKLQVISYLAPNWFGFYEAVLAYLGRVLAVETQLKQGECEPLLDPLLLKDQLDLAFICGLPLIRYSQIVLDQLQPVIAPVMQAPRYQNRPIYFSDAIVNANSDLASFDDLVGKTLCYNDPGSNSGYNLLRHRLFQGRHPHHFFGKVVQSGSHQNSIRWVAAGKVDCAAIDSVVLEQELRDFPELSQQLRVVEVLGPCPIPPLVAAQHLGKSLIQQIQLALLEPDAELQTAMNRVGVQRFAAVELADYEAIADIYNAAIKAGYASL
ncbi:phosphate ABC transporter substrate-binding protein [Nostoc sp. T09]|uniref:phosphate/phosphite/phosphonate ABC transporter substrate-binding protein n=1 Tax=Nostoc sp. T09 TaxID=1932621 RepID=UPI000A371B60|nr:PhnD/SsuA/transferrin family substrate-binding protein [Nostoc sp. T09]OUL32009.1 phosphate ABC transporter substrate-binding protein [Nostoc sp. T09]